MSLTTEELANALDKKSFPLPAKTTYKDFAWGILSYFECGNFIVDNSLSIEDRHFFYKLHDAGVFETSWENIELDNGKHWRIFYWELKEEEIRRTAQSAKKKQKVDEYATLPEEYWKRDNVTASPS